MRNPLYGSFLTKDTCRDRARMTRFMSLWNLTVLSNARPLQSSRRWSLRMTGPGFKCVSDLRSDKRQTKCWMYPNYCRTSDLKNEKVWLHFLITYLMKINWKWVDWTLFHAISHLRKCTNAPPRHKHWNPSESSGCTNAHYLESRWLVMFFL